MVDEQEGGGADDDASRSEDVAIVSAAAVKRAARIKAGVYGDVELKPGGDGKSARVTQLRTAEGGGKLPTDGSVGPDEGAHVGGAAGYVCTIQRGQCWVAPVWTLRVAKRTVRMTVDAEDSTTGIFLPKSNSKQHLLVAPTVDTVRNGLVHVAVLNVEGKREKVPAREALGTWIPTDDTMGLLEMNGELQRIRVAEWVATLNKEAAKPQKEEDTLDIGEMEPADRDLVVELLRQFAEIVEKKRCRKRV
ncbi:unnamed protein product [Phytophthora fragariaefolia]|uniref:Unnamed protein product n=1 Tax=Phytophthora fragariaefolia TaxID=1490495 RepID=A0A9W6U9C1_9STRA|nr:unnamed protein product [Phytophthora fragariaefolia]